MVHDWSRSEPAPEQFAFWSRIELIRVAVIAGLAIIPVSVSAIDAPKKKPSPLGHEAELSAPQAGRLLSTRYVAFDVKALDLAILGDNDPEKIR